MDSSGSPAEEIEKDGHPAAGGTQQESHLPETSTEWQRLAARRAFQKDLQGAIEAMNQAVTVDPLNFHHWMWLGSLYRQVGDGEGALRSARAALRCLEEAPNPTISPEERTRLIVRTSIHAGLPEGAHEALNRLQALRRTALDAYITASSFADWYEADLFAAPIFETLLELYGVLGKREGWDAAADRYLQSLERGMELGSAEGVEDEYRTILEERKQTVLGQRMH